MTDFKQARQNMVDGQIKTNGIIMPELIEALENTPRESFVPETHKNFAYNDEDIPLGDERYLLEPVIQARMIQSLDVGQDDVVLIIGGATGYAAALLSQFVSTVVVVEDHQEFAEQAAKNWDKLSVCNVVAFDGKLENGNKDNAPYDSIMINGAVAEVPPQILNQLAPEGNLICVIKKPGNTMGEITIFKKQKDGQISSYPLFDAATPYLKGFEPKPAFQF